MSGHNKWSKIKHKKSITDAKRSKEFSKIVLQISTEAKKCLGDKNSPGLQSAIKKAKAINMPSENIERAITKGSTLNSKTELLTYEGFGPAGSAFLVYAETDNKNRTASEIRHIFTKNGFSLGSPGSVSWMFAGDDMSAASVTLSEQDKEKFLSIYNSLEETGDVQEIKINVLNL